MARANRRDLREKNWGEFILGERGKGHKSRRTGEGHKGREAGKKRGQKRQFRVTSKEKVRLWVNKPSKKGTESSARKKNDLGGSKRRRKVRTPLATAH